MVLKGRNISRCPMPDVEAQKVKKSDLILKNVFVSC